MLGLFNIFNIFEEKGIVQRDRKPKEAVLFGILIYLKGLSTRNVSDLFTLCGVRVSHVAVWKWVQKFGSNVKETLFSKNGSLPNIIVADETCIQVGNRYYYLYAAICPYSKRIIYFDLYPMRNHLATLTFFKKIIKLYGRKPDVVIVDGGPWYKDVLNKLKIRRQVVCGSIRNYIERWFETLKDRLRNFDIYFPHKKPGVIDLYRGREENFGHVINWLYAFVYYYNRIRGHMSLGGRTPFKYYLEVLS
jgi:putative transposase